MIFETTLNTTTFMSCYNGNYSLFGYDELITQGLEAYMKQYDHQKLLDNNLAFILLSVTFEVIEKPKRGDNLTAKGSDGGIEGPILRKNIDIYKDDKLMVRSACFFGLINIKERKLQMNIADYFDNKPSLGQMKATSRNNLPLQGKLVNSIKILPSHLDVFEHCNNQRYYEFIFDCLSEKQRTMEEFSKIEMFYISEAKKDEILNIYCDQKDDYTLFYGLKKDDSLSFKAILRFDLGK